MRDPNRIDPFLQRIGEYWKLVPDWRFGQLLSNFLCNTKTDFFFWEEEEFFQKFQEYMDQTLDKH